jgi:DNA gyrase subunit A
MLFSDAGKAVRFAETDVRPMGRDARGVRGMMLEDGQSVIAMLVAKDESQSVLTATENGYGKRTPVAEYTRHGRGTKGMIAIQTSDRNGKLVAAVLVEPSDEIMLISTGGVLIRTGVESIREMGRSTQGVTLINLDEGTFLASVEKVAESESDESMRASAEAAEGAEAGAGGAQAAPGEREGGGDAPAAGEEGEA